MMTKKELIAFEFCVKEAWESGRVLAPIHLSGGNEDELLDCFARIGPRDYVFSTHRNHYHALLHGTDPDKLFAEIVGDVEHGTCKGRARSMGYIDVSRNFYSSAIVGGCVAIAVGVAWALKYEQQNNPLGIDEFATPPRHVWCFVGDGALDGGHFWEAYHYAVGWDLPITFVLEDNNRATCTPNKARLGVDGHLIPNNKYFRSYVYKPTYPHVGSGKYVQF